MAKCQNNVNVLYFPKEVGNCMHEESTTVKSYHHGNLKPVLIESALTLLREKGVAELSLREIAKKSGVSHAAPYRHFKNKAELLATIIEHEFDKFSDMLQKIQNNFPEDPVKQLTESGAAYVLYCVKNPDMAQLMFGGSINPQDTNSDFRKASQVALKNLIRIIRNGKQKNIFKDRKSLNLALASWSSMHGLAMLIVAGQVRVAWDTEEQLYQLSTLICSTILTGILKH